MTTAFGGPPRVGAFVLDDGFSRQPFGGFGAKRQKERATMYATAIIS